MPISLMQLEAFRTAVHEGTFTAAAVTLRMSQPAISDLVRRLEDELGSPVFLRGKRHLALTPAGEHLLPHVERALDAVQEGVNAVRALGNLDGGTATFGVLRNADLYLGDSLARRFHEHHPNVRIRLVGQNSAETADDVRTGALEAGLVTLPIEGEEDLDVLPLVRDEIMYVSLSPAHTATPVSTAELARRRLVLYDAHYSRTDPMRRQLAARAQLAGLRLQPVIEVEYLSSALDLVAAGFGDTLAPRGAIAPEAVPRGLRTAPLDDPLFDTIALVRRRGRHLSAATAEFVRLAHDVLLERAGMPGATVERLQPSVAIDAFLL